MPEPLTSQLVAQLIGDLLVAHPESRRVQNLEQTADTYRNGLAGLSGDAVRWAVKTSIQEDEYFPKVARLRKLAEAWQRKNSIAFLVQSNGGDPDVCHICGARVEEVQIQRPRAKWVSEYRMIWERDEEGNVILETITRERMTHDAHRHGIFGNGEMS